MDGITGGTGLRKWVGEEIRSSVNSPAGPPPLARAPRDPEPYPLLAGRYGAIERLYPPILCCS